MLITNEPKTIWEMTKQVNTVKGLKRTRYHTVNTRAKVLECGNFLRKAGEKQTRAGGKAALYEITAKAMFALLLDSLSIDDLIKELDEITTLSLISQIAAR